MRHALEEGRQSEERNHLIRSFAIRLRSCATPAIEQIGFCREMRKQPQILKHYANSARARRQEFSLFGIQQRLIRNCDLTEIGPEQSGNGGDNRGFSGARGPEQCGYS